MALGKKTLDKAVEEIQQKEDPTASFSYEDAILPPQSKDIIAVYGDKGDGKTTLTYGLIAPGSNVKVLSFDTNSVLPMELDYIKNQNLVIQVLDSLRPYDRSTAEEMLRTSKIVCDWNTYLLNAIKEKDDTDWIVVDGIEQYTEVCENAGRLELKIDKFQGVANQNLWKIRNMLIDNLHDKCVATARVGVIYIMYPKTDTTIVRMGQVIESEKVPKWASKVMKESQIVVHAVRETAKEDARYFAIVESSKKEKKYPPGKYDVTGTTLYNLINGKE
jgi:hypothetical protein